jgi:hypothetical protein
MIKKILRFKSWFTIATSDSSISTSSTKLYFIINNTLRANISEELVSFTNDRQAQLIPVYSSNLIKSIADARGSEIHH